MSAEARLTELGITLPPAPPKGGIYQPIVRTGNLAYVSGHGPILDNGTYMTGRLGENLSLEEGQQAARQTGLALLATIKKELGTLDKVARLVKSLGLVNSTADFNQQPLVVNGFSSLFEEIFGSDAGVGARSAMGTNVLPGNIPVEIEIILELKD